MESGVQTLIYIIIAVCVVLALALVAVLAYVWYKDNGKNQIANKQTGKKKAQTSSTKLQGIESVFKFLDFDTIVDSMIVRKNRTQYIMVIQCKGVNFDLLGEEEKLAVENGFTQFLNTLRYPVQLYVQSRSVNLKESIEKYEDKINEVKNDIIKLDSQIKKESANGRMDLVRKLEFDRRRKMNILEYGLDITNYVSKLSQNRNVLQQNTYVAVAYYTSEFGGQISNYSKEEIDNIAFSELYTRTQTLIRALSSAGVTGRVINSEELAELLYIAYNRDDSELINLRKSIDAQYDSLYNTAKDVLDKQKEMIEKKVDQEAIELVTKSIGKADRIIKLRKENKEEIRRRAMQYVEKYRSEMTDELYQETKKQVDKISTAEAKKVDAARTTKTEETTKSAKTVKSADAVNSARPSARRRLENKSIK